MTYWKSVVATILASASLTVMADPPGPGPGGGGVSCNPGCGTLTCAGGFCTACNAEGCHTFRDNPA
jgi:hypothetical protein